MSSRVRRRTVLGILALLLAAAVAGHAEWPQWRGPGGLGVSSEPMPLPETWEPGSPNIRWRMPIPGEGISSPVVSEGRVFVTTAYEGSRNALTQRLALVATVVVVLLIVWLWLRGGRRGAAEGSTEGLVPGRAWTAARIDGAVVLSVSFASMFLAVVLAALPDLFFELGNPGRVWRMAGAIALLGLAGAFGWFGRGSRWRLLGVAAVVVAAALLVHFAPSGPLGRARLSKWLPYLVLGLATATWYLIGFWRRPAEAPVRVVERAHHRWIAGLLLLLSALVFVPNNFLAGLQRVVVCLDLESGEILWERPVFSAPAEQKWELSTYATPTPATDGERLFAYFGHGLASVDFDGNVQWVRRFPGYSQSTRYGAGSSPIVTGDALVVVREQEVHQEGPPSWIGAFDKESGRPLWRVEPPGAHDSYTTPLLYRSGSGSQLLTASWKSLVAYDAGSGERLWSHDYPMEQMVASMAGGGDVLVLTGGVYGEKTLLVLRIGGESGGAPAEVLWQTNRGVATISSPVLYGGLLFTLTTPGIMTCYDAATGNELWKQRLDGEYFASLVAGDGKVYATNTEGSTMVIAAEPEFRLIGNNPLGERVYSSPAISRGCLLIRTADSLVCIDGRSAGPSDTL